MKKQIKYRPRSLSKEEKDYIKQQEIRGVIMSVIVLIAGLCILYAIFCMASEAVGL